jgi:CelD/BcsL family acetyltransferase involved in cellulose biosynthesis
MTAATNITTRLVAGFDDPAVAGLPAQSIFFTSEYQRAWWDTFGRGTLLPIVVEENGAAVAFAPLFADSGMVYFVGSGGSDYLDFRGEVSGERIAAIIQCAKDHVEDLQGFVFYHVRDASLTPPHLKLASEQLGWRLIDEGAQPAPVMDLTGRPAEALEATRKKSLVRHENAMRKSGDFQVKHFRAGDEIKPQLQAFFAQHIARWAPTPYPSLFLDPRQRAFYHRLCETAGDSGYLRFTRIDLAGHPAAFHFGFCHRGVYLWYKPTFDLALAKFSPGEVLLRQVLLAAIEEGAATFDFGLGDETYKSRFATHVNTVRNWGLYPPEQR